MPVCILQAYLHQLFFKLRSNTPKGFFPILFFIEKHLTGNEMKKIIDEYEKGNVYSKMSVWYDITIDDEKQNGSGMLEDLNFITDQ
jgi:hypothetical protein